MSSFDVKGTQIESTGLIDGWLSGRFHSESTQRFIPEGYEVPRVLIHLLSYILRRHGSWLYNWSLTATTVSACMGVSIANEVLCYGRLFSPSMHDVKTMVTVIILKIRTPNFNK